MGENKDPECDPANPKRLSYAAIKEAAERIEGGIIHTPLCEAKLSKFMDYEIFLKCENMQFTGSASERGLRNALMIAKQNNVKGCIVSSGGNYAMAAAYHGRMLNVPVTVVMPETAPMMKVRACREMNAKVVLHGTTVQDAEEFALKSGSDLKYINCSDHVDVLAGLGTVGLEVVSQLPEVDAVIVPVGGGGLLAGVLVACKRLKCSCLIYGAECAKVPTLMRTLQVGRRSEVPVLPSLADALSAPVTGANSLATIMGRLDRMLLVDEGWIARAVLEILEREKLLVEGAGACAVAAVMQGLVPELRGKRVVCVLSGGNLDMGTLTRVVQRGLAAAHRLLEFSVTVADSANGMAELMATLSEAGATVKSLITDQVWTKQDVFTTSVKVVIETNGECHCSDVKSRLRQKFAEVCYSNIY